MERRLITLAVLMAIAAALFVGIAYRASQQGQIAASAWCKTITDAGLWRASPTQIKAYLRQQHIPFHPTNYGIPGAYALDADIGPALTFTMNKGFVTRPDTLTLYFSKGELRGVGVEPTQTAP